VKQATATANPIGSGRGSVLLAELVALLFLGYGCGARQETGLRASSPDPAEKPKAGQHPSRLREPAVAGLFYPASAAVLSKTVDGLLEQAPDHYIPHLKALVCPHAGYEYSGRTAANAYKLAAGRDIRNVIILGPSHYAAFSGACIPDADAYRTPLGTVPISGLAKEFLQLGPFVLEPRCQVERPSWWQQGPKSAPPTGQDTPETWEHSVEVQVPFLQRTLKNFSVLPIVFGSVDPEAVAKVLAARLDDRTLLVASSDLSHYHPYDQAKALDDRCIKAICDLDIDQMKAQEACGKVPILALMSVARQKGWKTRLLDARNSGDATGDKSGGVVGYAAVAFYAPGRESLGTSDRKLMLELARRTVASVATNGPLPSLQAPDVSSSLTETKGCFVTLTEGGALRGCIGHIVPQEPLYLAVRDNAQSAALRDPRFNPVRPDEVSKIHIEISVLTRPEPLPFKSPEDLLNKLRPYEDGVVIQIGSRGATFLPQVWAQIPDKVEFLNHLSEKAGCAPSDWRGKDTSVSIYHVESFEEDSVSRN
jgi:MEMO1 family protein